MINVGQTIYRNEIKLDFIKNNVEYIHEEFKVLGENKDNFCINDHRFTTLQYKDEGFTLNTPLNKVSVSHMDIKPYHDYIYGVQYTDNPDIKTSKKAIKRELEKFIYDRFGRYTQSMELLSKVDIGESHE